MGIGRDLIFLVIGLLKMNSVCSDYRGHRLSVVLNSTLKSFKYTEMGKKGFNSDVEVGKCCYKTGWLLRVM